MKMQIQSTALRLHLLMLVRDIVADTVAEKTQSSTIRFAQTGTVLHLASAVASDDSAMEAIELVFENN